MLADLRFKFPVLAIDKFEVKLDPKTLKGESIHADYECPICFNIVWDARICLKGCQKMFCAQCVANHLKTKNTCPCCRKN